MSTVLDLFAGPGGWSEACRDLGLSEVGVEWDATTAMTAVMAGHQRLVMDARHYPVPAQLGGLIASPPCQTFSTAGRGNGRRLVDRLVAAVPLLAQGAPMADAIGTTDTTMYPADDALFGMAEGLDDRGTLVLEPLRFIRWARPTWVALEQVPSVLPIWDAYSHVLRQWGYHTLTAVVSAERYGVPQTRRRAILLASREHVVLWPRATHSAYHRDGHLDEGMPRWVSMAEALGWGMTARPYPTVAAGTAAGGTDPMALGGSGARAIVTAERDAGRWRVNDQSGTERMPEWPWHRPATTVAGRDLIPDPGTNANRFNGATKSRNDGIRVTLQEAAILQGFPSTYPWQGTRSQQFQQVGDAVPPPLARALLEAVCT